MRLIFLSKRRPQQRDLIERPYGRFHHLPMELAKLGHEVKLILIDHAANAPRLSRDTISGVSRSVVGVGALGWQSLSARLAAEANPMSPDWVVGCSDSWVGLLAHRVALRCGCHLAIDAYDNYEAYMPWNLPLRYFWRRTLRSADLITTAGPQLAELLDRERPGSAPATIVPMAADPPFVPLDRLRCRHRLGLPESQPLLGYYGGWASSRGTSMLHDAWKIIRAQRPDVRLVLTGRPPQAVIDEPGVLALGYIKDQDLPSLINALDAACVVTANSSFGRYSYPSKLCEAIACEVPVAATDTAPVRWMLGSHDRFLSPTGDTRAFALNALSALAHGPVDYGLGTSWVASARVMEQSLETIARQEFGDQH